MRDQYAGDISDVLKFAFLRALARDDRALGVAWYYAPDNDGRADGRHLEWRGEAAWRLLDAQLHTGLSALPERSIAALERAAIWPKGCSFIASRCRNASAGPPGQRASAPLLEMPISFSWIPTRCLARGHGRLPPRSDPSRGSERSWMVGLSICEGSARSQPAL